jgi:RNA recognition motif-containing protein
MQRDLDLDTPIGRPEFDDLVSGGRGLDDTRPVPARPNNDRPNPNPASRHDKQVSGSGSIYVGNLPWKASAADLERLFGRHGEVIGATVATRNGRSKGYGFVDMHESVAPAAVDALQGAELQGRSLRIRFAKPTHSRR